MGHCHGATHGRRAHITSESFRPPLQLASAYGKLGNIDANTGDAQTGWDTDQFLTDPKETLLVAATILKQGGLAPGDSST